ncbi:MAG: hypothetical protein ACHREM_14105 [Polyangiales bacterium]
MACKHTKKRVTVPYECPFCEVERLGKQAATMRHSLESIGRNVCGREPLAAAYARGILQELKEGA